MPGTWTKLTNSPGFNASTMLLLTDGSVMCQQSGGVKWSKLTPDDSGSYVNGTWTPLAPMINTRLYYASAVLRDGRVIVCGGEYSNAGSETNKCEIYDPVADTWTAVSPPAGWTNVGDAAACLLPDGRLLMGYYQGTKTAIYDPVAGSWSAGPDKGDSASEETWTLLGDGTVLTVQCSNTPFAEKYLPSTNKWVKAGKLPVNIVENSSLEIGPAVRLPDGRAFCVGATNHTALYTPPATPSQPGNWAAGPDFPNISGKTIGAKDAPGCLLPNGRVLIVGGPVDGLSGSYLSPTYFFEFDGTKLVRVTDPPNATGVPYAGRMLMVPSARVLFAAGTNEIYNYVPDKTTYPVSWRPVITSAPTFMLSGGSYTLQGRQITGLSHASVYGDDATMASNYPIVRLKHSNGKVYYCRTSGHSTMGIATGAALHTTNFHVDGSVPAGSVEITVVSNGIASEPVSAFLFSFHWPRVTDLEAWVFLLGSLGDGPLWGWGPNGPVPVDPWGPKVIREATVARRQMLNAMLKLQAIGSRVAQIRETAAANVPPSVDLDALGESGEDGAKKSAGKKSAASRITRRKK